MSSKPTIVLVPGAWHSPDCFHLVTAELQAAGYETKGVNSASVGAATPLKDFYPDVEAIQHVLKPLAEEGKDIVLVVHSYGGVIGSEAVRGFAKGDREKEGKKGGISHIYFCCAFMLPEGTSLIAELDNKPLPWFQVNDAEDSVTPATPVATFYNDVKEPEKYVKMLKPHSYRTFFTPIGYAGWRHVPNTYLLCEKDEAIPIWAQKGMVEAAQKAGADVKVETVDASHSPFLSIPEEMTRSIRRAAGESV